jgi:hypothetical protein
MRNGFLRRTTAEDTSRPIRRATASTPRWVKVAVGIFLLLVLVIVILHLTGNGFGEHMHMERGRYPL